MLAQTLIKAAVFGCALVVICAAHPVINPHRPNISLPVNGEFVRLNDKGDTVYIGHFKKNRLHGQWSSWYANRQRCDSGRLENAVADGVWKIWYPGGKLRYECHFSEQKLLSLKDEIRRQPKIRYYALSQLPVADAALHYNAKHVFGHAVSAQQSVMLSQQLSQKPLAPEILDKLAMLNATQGEQRYHPPFAEGLLHGTYTAWNPDGSIQESGLYLNGLREGIWEIYKAGNIKGVGTYKHGRPNGEWRYYTAQGRLLSWKRFDAKGRVSSEHIFRADQ